MLIKLWDWDKGWICTQIFEGHSHYVMQVNRELVLRLSALGCGPWNGRALRLPSHRLRSKRFRTFHPGASGREGAGCFASCLCF